MAICDRGQPGVAGFGWLIYRVVLDEMKKHRALWVKLFPPSSLVPRSRFVAAYLVALAIGISIGFVMNVWGMGFAVAFGIGMVTHWEVAEGKSPYHYVVPALAVVPLAYLARRAGWIG